MIGIVNKNENNVFVKIWIFEIFSEFIFKLKNCFFFKFILVITLEERREAKKVIEALKNYTFSTEEKKKKLKIPPSA